MIVEPVSVEERAGTVTRAATVRWPGGEYLLRVQAPVDLADTTDDASGFLCATLLPAMRFGEDLEIRGPVSPGLLRRADEIRALYNAWMPDVRDVGIECDVGEPGTAAGRTIAFFSRGVDSMFTAAHDHAGDGRIDALVFVDALEPRHDAGVRAHEIEQSRAVAQLLDLPMYVAETNIRGFADPIILDWEDMCGAGLSFVGHALAGGARGAVISATDNYATLEPAGTSPLLDPLFSTERVTIEHSSLARGRLAKIRWIVEHQPELVPYIKVCFRENRMDNCCVCPKCVFTMACLHVCDALDAAPQFPVPLDIEGMAASRLPLRKHRADWATLAALEDDRAGGALRAAARAALRGAARPAPTPPNEMRASGFRWLNETLSLLVEGDPPSAH